MINFFQELKSKWQKKMFDRMTEKLCSPMQTELLWVDGNGDVWFGKRKLPQDEIIKLRQDVQQFEESKLWKTIMAEFGNDGRNNIYNRSQTRDDLIYYYGKAELRFLEMVELIINKIKNL